MNSRPVARTVACSPRGGMNVQRIWRRACDHRGAVTLMFALSASLMIGALSMSIDLIRYEISQARLQAALDAANLSASVDMGHYGTSGCPTAGLATWQADALAYYNVNMPSDYLDLWTTNTNFSATCSANPSGGQLVQLSASGTLPLITPTFLKPNNTVTSSGSANSDSTMQVIGVDEVLRTPQTKLELALVLDNTGSMADPPNDQGSQAGSYSGSKIAGLKTAAASLLTSLFSQNSSTYYVGIVPFASTVNVKGSLSSTGSWLNNVNNFNPGGLPAATPDSTFNGYTTGSATGPVSYLQSGSTYLGQWSWTTSSTGLLSGSYLNGTTKSAMQQGTFAFATATTSTYPTATWSWTNPGSPTALPDGSWWSWKNAGWGGCVVEPRDSNGNLWPAPYTASGSQGQFTPYYYNVWPTGTWTATTTGYSDSTGTTGSVPFTTGSTTGPGMSAWSGSAKGTMSMTMTVPNSTNKLTTVSWTWTPSRSASLAVSANTLQSSEAALSTWPQSGNSISFSGSYTLPTTASNQSGTYTLPSSSSTLTWTWNPASAASQTSTINSGQYTQNYMCIGTPVMFLTNDHAALTGEINAMQPSGDTVIPLGLLWGWRMLSSSWSDAVAGTGNGWNQSTATGGTVDLPMAETTSGLQRVMILMTDGVNSIGSPTTTFNGLTGSGTDSLGTSTGSYLTTSGNNGVSNVDAFEQQVCTAIKNQGITLYTIAFGTGAAANTELQSCASPGDFFYASDNSALNTVFQQIATNIGMLQLTK